jgi:hypothetical protein
MILKTGHFVSHAVAQQWGAGKVLEVTSTLAVIHFSDGQNRKIAASHFTSLLPATLASYVPPANIDSVVKPPTRPRAVKRK